MRRRELLLESCEDRILCDAAPNVTVNAPANPKIGDKVPVTVTFNNSGTSPGYGPYVDLVLDHATGVTGTGGGVDFVVGSDSATYLGNAVTTTKLTFQAADAAHPLGAWVTHPYAKDANGAPLTVYAPSGYGVGDTLLVLQLPFGSFTPTQPAATINLDVTVSNLAEVNHGLNISARGGFQYGNDALDNPVTDPSLVGGYQNTTVTPQVITLTKTYLGPENETATGPDYVRQYKIDVDVADGQTVTNLDISDLLPNNMQFVSLVGTLDHNGNSTAASVINSPGTTTPGGTLDVRFASVTGLADGPDASLIFSFFIPRIDSGNGVIVPGATGTSSTATDTANATAKWNPIDTGDPQNVTTNAGPVTHTLTVKALATQKSVSIVNDTGTAGATPGDTLEYTIQMQVSDYFAFQSLQLSDIISDGQRLDPLFTPTITWSEQGSTFGSQNFLSSDFTVTPHFSTPGDGVSTDGTDGTTGVVFNISGEIARPLGQDGILLGGAIPAGGTGAGPLPNDPPFPSPTGPGTVTITYRTIVLRKFSDNAVSGDTNLNPGDLLGNKVVASGAILNVTDASTPTGGTATDDSVATIAVPPSAPIVKSIYAINGSTNLSAFIGPSGQILVKPGDTVTYRLEYQLSIGTVENLELTDFLPLPTFDATTVTTFDDVLGGAIPVTGHATFGPDETLRPVHGSAPTITTNAGGNSVVFDYGTTDNPLDTPKTVDILFTVAVSSAPFADGSFLTNLAQASENNTQHPTQTTTSNSIVGVELQEPNVAIYKGVVGYNSTGLTLGGLTFNAPGSNSAFGSGTLSDATQAAAIGANDATNAGLDGGDLVRYGIVVQNTGRSDAFDVNLSDPVPPDYVIPATLAGLNLIVTRGDGTKLTLGTDYTVTYNNVTGALGVRLIDNYTAGNTGNDTSSGGLSRGHNANNDTAITNGSNSVVITYDVALQTTGAESAQAGSTITNTATLTNFDSTPGGPNFIPDGLKDSASVALVRPTLTKVLIGTEISQPGNNGANQAVIGELVTYTLTVTVPEGSTPNAVLNDVLDPGLAFVDISGVSLSSGLTLTGGTTPTVTNDGHNLAFNFGTINNANTNNAVPETITITYRAVVLDENTAPAAPGNQAGTTLHNTASFTAQYIDVPTGAPTNYTVNQSAPTANVTVVEPALTLTTGVSTSSSGPFTPTLNNVDAADAVFFLVHIANLAGSPTAFDATLDDTLPTLAGLTIVSVTGAFNTSDFTISGGHLITSSPAGLDFAGGDSVDILVQGTIPPAANAAQVFTSTANLQWTSLDGTPGQRSANNTASTERTGTGGVGSDASVLDNYAAIATATITDGNPAVDKRFQGGSLTADDTSVATAGTNTLDQVVVGESVLYDILVTLPEGTTQNLRVDDLIPAGMRLDTTFNGGTGFQLITSAAASNGQLGADFNPAAPLSATLTTTAGGSTFSDDADARLTFGDVVVNADNAANNNSFIIRVRAIVDDVITNQSGTTLNNAAQIVFTSANTTVSDPTPNDHTVTVIEPTLSINKTVPALGGDSGDPITYTITISNPNGSSQADAYNVLLNDVIPTLVTAPSIVTGTFTATGFGSFTTPTAGDFQIVTSGGNSVLQIDPAFTLNIPLGGSITLQVTGTISNAVVSGQTISNTAQTSWTSTPGTNADERTGAGIPNPTQNTPDGAVLDNYAIGSTAVTTAASSVATKEIIATSESSTLDNFTTGQHDVAPGEIVTYRVTVTLAEGRTPNVVLTDLLPNGLALIPGTLSLNTTNFGGSITGATAAPVGGPTYQDGTDATFTFTGTNPGDNNAANNSFSFTYQTVVLDVASNVGLQGNQTVLPNLATGSVNGGATRPVLIGPGGNTVTLVEPDLAVNKTVTVNGGASGDAGDPDLYSVVISHKADSLAEAFDATYSDPLPSELGITNISQVTVTHSTLGDITNRFQIVNVGGNFVLQTIPGQSFDLALGETLTITAASALTGAVSPNETINSTATVAYTGLPGNKTAAGGYNPSGDVTTDHERPYSVSDDSPVTVPAATLSKTLFSTSETNTTGSNVAIGETATYALKVTLPEGTTSNLVITDLLPVGMQYVSSQIVSTTAASSGLLTADFAGTVPAPTITGGTGDGTATAFTFGPVTTTGDNATGNNSFLILITTRVLNETSNVGTTGGQTVLSNTGQLVITGPGAESITTPPVDVTVVEPRLQVVKGVDDPTPDVGQTLHYTLTLDHTADSTENAYQVIVRDALPAGLTMDPASIQINGVNISTSPLVTAGSNTSTSSLLAFQLNEIDLGATVTITYTAVVAQTQSLAGTNLDNNARIYWDTLVADDGTNSVQTGTANPSGERDLGAKPGYTEDPTPSPDDPAQDTARVTVNAAAITGTVYFDANANGVFDGGDTGISGVTLTLTGTDLNGNALSRTTTSDGSGNYSFLGLPAGAYTLTETQPPSYIDGVETVGTNFGGTVSNVLGADTIAPLTISAQSVATGAGYNFGELRPSSVATTVYYDANDNGTQQVGEPGIAGTSVRLTGTDIFGQSVTLNGLTDANGTVVFDNGGTGLRPGTYTITEVTQPAGYLDGIDTAGTVNGDATTVNDQISDITLPQNTAATGYLFGELLPASLSGNVYADRNNNGAINGGEPGIAGVTVTLTGTDDLSHPVNLTTTTAGDGTYSFTNLRPGTYNVAETQPSGYLDGQDTLGTPGGGAVGADQFTGVTIKAGDADTAYNFGELEPSSVSGRVYDDRNNNGAFNGAETGIAGVTVQLTGTDDLGAVNLTTTTLADGTFSFANLRPGTYTVVETQPGGYFDGKETTGSLGGSTAVNDQIGTFTLPTNTNATNYLFGELLPSSLSGVVYQDLNNNGHVDSGEAGVSGVTITLTGTDDLNQPVTQTMTTDGTGNYSFDGLRPGTYVITETQPGGLLDGKDTIGTPGGTTANDVFSAIVLPSATNGLNNNFGELPPSTISGGVYIDSDNNGVRGPLETAIPGVTVTLTGTDDLGHTIASQSMVTDANGNYAFTNLRPGTYTVTETQPGGFLDGIDTAGSTTGSTTTNDTIGSIPLAPDTTSSGNNFGELRPSSISGTVFVDNNNDGNKGLLDSGVDGATMILTGTDDLGHIVVLTTTTAADGTYSFTNLRPGTYTLQEVQPAGLLDGKDTVGSQGNNGLPSNDRFNFTIGENVNGTDNNFAELEPASIAGSVYVDGNKSGTKDPNEAGIPNATVRLTGIDDRSNAVSITVKTDQDGAFLFDNLRPGTYTLTETQPAGYSDGKDTAGSQSGDTSVNDHISGITLKPGDVATDYLFGEFPLPPVPPPAPPSPIPHGPKPKPEEPGLIFAFDGFNNFANDGFFFFGQPTPGWGQVGPIDIWGPALLPLAPIYSGEGDPGATLRIDLYGANGALLASQSVVVDPGGNWLANFAGVTLRDLPREVTITETDAPRAFGSNSGFNLRTYYAPTAINPGHFIEMSHVGGPNEGDMPLLDGLDISNPLLIDPVKYGAEILPSGAVPAGN